MIETIPDLAGLARTDPRLALPLPCCLVSLAGIPPFAGFFAKFYVFLAAIDAHLYTLAILGALASAIGAYYYLRIVKIIYFDESAPAFEPRMGRELGAIAAVSSLFNLFFVLVASPIVDWSIAAAKAFTS